MEVFNINSKFSKKWCRVLLAGIRGREGDVQPFWEAFDNSSKTLKNIQTSIPFNLCVPPLRETHAHTQNTKISTEFSSEDDGSYGDLTPWAPRRHGGARQGRQAAGARPEQDSRVHP